MDSDCVLFIQNGIIPLYNILGMPSIHINVQPFYIHKTNLTIYLISRE